jgi:hypothetical protein
LHGVSLTTLKDYLKADLYCTLKEDLFHWIPVVLRGWNVDCTSVVDICPLPPMRAACFELWITSLGIPDILDTVEL